MHASITISRRFCGPPESGNGGYTAGSLARYVHGTAEVTLRRPSPLDRPLHVERNREGARMLDGETLIAEAMPATIDIDPPAPVDLDAATRAAAAAPIALNPSLHPFPTCFVCGPARTDPDGLRIFPGPVSGTELFAAAWTPRTDDDLIVWGVLDCMSSAGMYLPDDGDAPAPHVLGRIAARIDSSPAAHVPHVVMSWALGREGRKFFGASAIFGPDGCVCAVARSTWIALNAA
jgi:hypothetical protein